MTESAKLQHDGRKEGGRGGRMNFLVSPLKPIGALLPSFRPVTLKMKSFLFPSPILALQYAPLSSFLTYTSIALLTSSQLWPQREVYNIS